MAEPKLEIIELDIELLQPNPLQPRGLITPESLAEMVNSIQEHGILEPLIVAQTPAGYQIIAGERRWRASRLAGLKTVPVIIKETSNRGMLEMALVENVQREDLNPLERAHAFKRLVEEFNLTYQEIGKRISKSESFVSNSLRLLALPDALKDGLLSGTITEGHARALLALESDPKTMIEAYKIILQEAGSVRRAEELARLYKAKIGVTPQRTVVHVHNEELVQMEEELKKALAAREVKIFQSSVSATLTIYLRGNQEKTTKVLRDIDRALRPAS